MTARPRTTRAAILASLRQPLIVDEVSLPSELDVGQILIQIVCSGICGAQINEIDGVKGDDPFLPHLLGHEGFGKVVETGPGVTNVKAGDSVVLHWKKGRGIESRPPEFLWRGARLNAGWVTTFSEYSIVSENRVTAVAADVNPEVAALFGCAVTTAFGVMQNNAHLKIGESVVVFGAGGVGLNVIQVAALMSADPIVAVDLHPAKLDMARRCGATHVINARADDLKSGLSGILGPAGADVVVETTGQKSVIETAYEISGPQGRVVLVGVPKKGDAISIYSLPLHFGKVLTGSHGGDARPEVDIPRYLRLYHKGLLPLDGIITDRFSLNDINTAIDRLRTGDIAGRCVIHPGRSGEAAC